LTKEILLNKGLIALVSDEDFEWVSKIHWTVIIPQYGSPNASCLFEMSLGNRIRTCMGRAIWIKHHGPIPSMLQIDHINGNPLDNRIENIRICRPSENFRNRRKQLSPSTSKFKGVHWDKKRKKWIAGISFNKKHYDLGAFNCEEDAARAYDSKARDYHGEFARLNFPDNKK
jgi:hypothetical protein